MNKIISLLLFFLCLSATCEETKRSKENLPVCLGSFLSETKAGDFIVLEALKVITIMRIWAVNPQTIVIEEISTPRKHLPSMKKMSWQEWIYKRAPGHTSWSMIEISLNNGEILECYSFSQNSYIQLSPRESLLANLLKRPLEFVAENNRRRVGPPPIEGEEDYRKTWIPPFTFEGNKVSSLQIDVYETSFPEDGSELSGRPVIVYFDREKRTSLPIWVEVQTSHFTGKFQVIDSGKGLSSCFRKAPKKSPIERKIAE